jgi:hypothetical protein
MSTIFWYLIDNVTKEKTPDPVTPKSTYPAKYPESRIQSITAVTPRPGADQNKNE